MSRGAPTTAVMLKNDNFAVAMANSQRHRDIGERGPFGHAARRYNAALLDFIDSASRAPQRVALAHRDPLSS